MYCTTKFFFCENDVRRSVHTYGVRRTILSSDLRLYVVFCIFLKRRDRRRFLSLVTIFYDIILVIINKVDPSKS